MVLLASYGPVAQGCLIDWFGAAPSLLVRGLPDEYVRVLGRRVGRVSHGAAQGGAAKPRAASGWARSAHRVDRSATGLLRLRYLEDCLGGVPA